MTSHTVGTREEWRTARVQLLEPEKELTRRSDELAQQRQALPWVPIDEEYVFDTEEGQASLADLFRGRSQLLVHHFMFDSGWDEGCPSLLVGGRRLQRLPGHLEHRDVAMSTISRAPIEKLLAYRQRMGWSFPWASSANISFNFVFGGSYTERQLAAGAEHNFRPLNVDVSQLPHRGEADDPVQAGESHGVRAFVLEDGEVFHTYSCCARGSDVLWGMYQWLDRAPFGRNEHGPWFKRHDQYDETEEGWLVGATVMLAHVAGMPVEEVLSPAVTAGGMASAGTGWRGGTSDQRAGCRSRTFCLDLATLPETDQRWSHYTRTCSTQICCTRRKAGRNPKESAWPSQDVGD